MKEGTLEQHRLSGCDCAACRMRDNDAQVREPIPLTDEQKDKVRYALRRMARKLGIPLTIDISSTGETL
jgi:hypothetical protein